MSPEVWLTYIAACIIIAIVPGPGVSLIIANSVRYGWRAGIANVAGIQLGLAFSLTILVVGLASVMTLVSQWFDYLRLAGATYLVWLGVKLLLSDGKLIKSKAVPTRSGFFVQGVIVTLVNPKLLLFFGAFIPQFVDPTGDTVLQIAVLGLTFMFIVTILDSSYALLVGNARNRLTQTRVRILERFSGLFLVCGGLYLALARR